MSASRSNPDTGRLSVQTVERLHRLLGGDAPTEQMILMFISARWQARNLFYLPAKVAAEAIARPWDFIHAAKNFQTTDLPF